MLKVNIPVQLRNHILFQVEFKVTSLRQQAQWQLLHRNLIVNGVVQIPPCLAHYKYAVPDKLVYVWRGSKLEKIETNRPVRPGGIYLVAESPHRHEFDNRGHPIGPLMNKVTRLKVETHLPRLIQQAINLTGITLDDVDVVLGNPIQFQCSLHSLMRVPEQALQPDVRNAVWRNLFKKKVNGVELIQEHFKRRVQSYAPVLLLLAPTYSVRQHVRGSARGLARHVVEIHSHPSIWNRDTNLPSC